MSNYPLLWLTLLFSLAGISDSYSQPVNFEDGFEDGNFTGNPAWGGDTGDFMISFEEQNYLLQLDGDSVNGGTSYLSTPSSDTLGSWEFYIRLGFAPSGSNRSEIFLMSDRANLNGPVSGYALRAGESGSDDVFRVVRYDEGTEAEIVLSGTTDISGGGAFRVKVTREAGGIWTLKVAEGYAGSLTQEGDPAADATYNAAQFLGIRSIYTSSRHDLFAYDFRIDLQPFAVTRAIANHNHIEVTFNRSVDQHSVQPGDFSVTNKASPASINFPSPAVARLTFSQPLSSGAYTLAVRDLLDLHGNVITSDSSTTFIVFGNAEAGDIVITEFMYDPPGGLSEYVELKNRSDKFLNLQNWHVGDASNNSIISADTLVLPPDNFLAISPDTSALFSVYGPRPYAEPGSVPALNNSGDALKIITSDGLISDSLTYSSSWGGSGVALERRSVSTSAVYRENWSDSPDPAGGTPGAPNKVPEDRAPPELLDIRPVSESMLQLVFSERVTEASAEKPSNYQISPNRRLQRIAVQTDSITLFLDEPLASGETYTVSVAGIADLFGNKSSSSHRDISYLQVKTARRGDIILNEFMPAPGNEAAEFIELYNRTDKNIDLANWSLGDFTHAATLPETTLRAGHYLVITGNASFARARSDAIVSAGFPNLNDSGDLLYLRNSSGGIIDSLHYRSSWGNYAEGQSLERKDPLAASNDPSNWRSSTSNGGHTAGGQNSSFAVDESPPRVRFANIRWDGRLGIRFNEFIRRTGKLQFSMDGTPLAVSAFDTANAHEIILQPPAPASGSAAQTIHIEHLADIRGNMRRSSEIPVARPLRPGDLVINEIMYEPIQNADDMQTDQSEYVELVNTSDEALSLEGVMLHDAPDEDGQVVEFHPISTTAKWVLPHETVLLYTDPSAAFAQSDFASFFEVDTSAMQTILQVDRNSLGLSSEDAVYIADSSGAIIDSVYYSDAWHNPNLADTRGIALERITPGGASNSGENWGSSTHPRGGTPKAQNSIHQEEPERPRDTGIRFVPNPFSPDGDGYEDNLAISYKLDQSDYLLRVHIFDRYGRHIKKLADGLPAGFEGTLVWDGRSDEGRRNRIGIYIVVFEAYDSASGSNKAFKKTVVLARQLH